MATKQGKEAQLLNLLLNAYEYGKMNYSYTQFKEDQERIVEEFMKDDVNRKT